MASDQAQSQLPARPEAVIGCEREADLVGDGGFVGVGHEGGRHRGVDPHAALALLEQRQVLVEAVVRRARRAGFVHHVDVEVQRLSPGGLVELGGPLFVEPAGPEGIRHRREERHVLAPAGLAASADAVDLVVAVGHCRGGLAHELPGGSLGHLEAGLLHEVLAVHHHRRLAVERRGVERAVHRQAIGDGGQQVVGVPVVGHALVERHEPVVRAPDGHFVGADRHHVVLSAAGGDVGRDVLAQHVLLERDPFERYVGIGFEEVVGQALHPDHVAVVHGRDRQGRLVLGMRQRGRHAQRRSTPEGARRLGHVVLPKA